MRNNVSEIKWAGGIEPCIDDPTVRLVGSMVLGTYGGNSNAGANKNEDGALLWSDGDADWEFAVIFDGHNTSESVQLLLDNFTYCKSDIIEILNSPISNAFEPLHEYIVTMLSSLDTSSVHGESSCLVFVRKGRYLWWLNIGDCILYLLNEEYARLGQYAVNQRSYFEWVGEVNTFHQTVPCYSTGVKPLRKGRNVILAVTDGVLEFGERQFETPKALYDTMFDSEDIQKQVREVLGVVHSSQGIDSATIIAWNQTCNEPGQSPSDS
jgi:hypothetical protein